MSLPSSNAQAVPPGMPRIPNQVHALPMAASVTCDFSHSVIQHYSIGNAVAGSQQALPLGTGSEEPNDN